MKAYTNRSNATRAAKRILTPDVMPFVADQSIGSNGSKFIINVSLRKQAFPEIADSLAAKGVAVSACNDGGGVVDQVTSNTSTKTRTPTMTTTVDKTALEAAVTEAEATYDTSKATVKQTTTDLRDAKKNRTAAERYLKSLADEAEERPAAAETLAGWEAEVTRLEAAEANAKAEREAAKEGVKTAKANLRGAGKAAREAEAAERKAARENRVEQNGMKQPSEGTPSAKLWAAYDAVAAELGRPPAYEEVAEAGLAAHPVAGTVKAAYAHWRKFHGITGRVQSAAQIQAAADKVAAKEKAAAEKAAAKAAKEAKAAEEKAAKDAAAAAKAAEAEAAE